MAKVFCSEQLDMVVGRGGAVHGGYGYIAEYPVERYYRDSRIQRIFEGTNEINRILIPTMFFRRADSNGSVLWELVKKAQQDIAGNVAAQTAYSGEFALEAATVARLKQLFLAVLGEVAPAREHQEVLLAVADMAITIFALESVVLRVDKTHVQSSEARQKLLQAVAKVAAFELSNQFRSAASRCCAYALTGEAMINMQKTVSNLPPAGWKDCLKQNTCCRTQRRTAADITSDGDWMRQHHFSRKRALLDKKGPFLCPIALSPLSS